MVERELSDKNKNVVSTFAIFVFAVALFFFLFFSTNLFNSDADNIAQIRKVEKKLEAIEIPEIPEAEFIQETDINSVKGPPSLPPAPNIGDYDLIAHPMHSAFAEAYDLSINNGDLSVSDDIIYNTGYYSVNGGSWQSFSLQGTPYGGEHPWVLDTGTVNLPSSLEGEGAHFIIIYSCSLENNVWSCHGDLENGVMVNKWQLRVVENGDPGCTSNCQGRVCGDDGCGESCGSCTGGQTCNNGVCEGSSLPTVAETITLCDSLCDSNSNAYCALQRTILDGSNEVTGTCRSFSSPKNSDYISGFHKCQGFCKSYGEIN